MTTTITVTAKRQVVLPKVMCERKRIRPGTSLRITEVGDGFYVTKDKDLLALEKPFGVEVVTPRGFYRRLES